MFRKNKSVKTYLLALIKKYNNLLISVLSKKKRDKTARFENQKPFFCQKQKYNGVVGLSREKYLKTQNQKTCTHYYQMIPQHIQNLKLLLKTYLVFDIP